jgi:hypothetical protein
MEPGRSSRWRLTARGRLYVGGFFTDWATIASADNIAVWDGASWSAADLGVNDPVYAIVAVPGSTSQVLVGGDFTQAGGNPAERLARYDAADDTWLRPRQRDLRE